MSTEPLAVELIAGFEGFRSRPYLCPAGHWTIGYGTLCLPSTAPVTEEQALDMLEASVEEVRSPILAAVPALESQDSRRAAVLSWVYNLGMGRFRASTFRRRLQAGEWALAAQECRRWVWGGGRRLPGLVARREVEARLLEG